MKYWIIVFAFCTINLLACQTAQNSQQEIVRLEKLVKKNAAKEDVQSLLDLYQNYTKANPEDEQTPLYLYKAHDMALSLGKHKEAIEICEKIYTMYPKFEKAPSAMFLAAFNYENYLHDLPKAEKLYKEFIQTYPNDAFVKDAKISLDNLGLSPEEMLQKIQQQNQQ